MKNLTIISTIAVVGIIVAAILVFGGDKNSASSDQASLGGNINKMQQEENNSKEVTIEDVREGEGEGAKNGDTLAVHYVGTLEDGTKFDSSYDRGEPITFVLGAGQLIPGWEKGLVGMKVGGERKLIIPPEFGYGETGVPGFIPPNATLLFTLELISIN